MTSRPVSFLRTGKTLAGALAPLLLAILGILAQTYNPAQASSRDNTPPPAIPGTLPAMTPTSETTPISTPSSDVTPTPVSTTLPPAPTLPVTVPTLPVAAPTLPVPVKIPPVPGLPGI